jgi:hypothetical protein
MIEIQNVTVYKCEHCEYTDTLLGRMKSHENECLSKQLKTAKNKDKQEIYNILDIDLINIKIKEFLGKYNLPVSTEIEYCYLIVGNSLYVDLELTKSIRGIFDKSSFKIYTEIARTRNSEEHLDSTFREQLKEICANILIKESELGNLFEKRKDLVLESMNSYLKGIKRQLNNYQSIKNYLKK